MKNKLDTRIIRRNKLRNRIWELDFLRGICLLLMIFDHTLFDIGYIFDTAWIAAGNESVVKFVEFSRGFWDLPLRVNGREVVIITFFVISGISCSFSRSNFKRGLQLLIFAMIITLVTVYLSNNFTEFIGMQIRYGVLHMLASCMLIWAVINLIFRDPYKTAAACFIVAIVVFILNANMNMLTAGHTPTNNMLAFLHGNFETKAYLIREMFSPGDYFPLFPNLGIFMIGSAIAPVIYNKRRSLLPFLDKFRWYRPINFFGRNALVFVVLHQPLIAGVLALISAIFITPGDFVLI